MHGREKVLGVFRRGKYIVPVGCVELSLLTAFLIAIERGHTSTKPPGSAPDSPMSAKLKDTLLQMMKGGAGNE